MIAIAVCIPIRNERARLPALMAALRRQDGTDGLAISLCCFLDGCEDGSETVVRDDEGPFALRLAHGSWPGEANAGRARAAAVAIGLAAVGDVGLVLTTDADSVPAPDWIRRGVEALAGCDVVAGRILRDGACHATQDRLEAYYDRLHAYRRRVDPVDWDPLPGHHHTGGANLGFTAAAYRAIGGFQPRPAGEDALFVDEAARAGLRVRHDPMMRVSTSSRREGRAAGGLAAQLRHGDSVGGAALRVGDPAAAAWQYGRHAATRAGFAGLPSTAEAVGRLLGLSADHVIGVARDCPNAEAFAMRIVPAAPGADATLVLAEAEQVLARLEAEQLDRAA